VVIEVVLPPAYHFEVVTIFVNDFSVLTSYLPLYHFFSSFKKEKKRGGVEKERVELLEAEW
jgi:hypothetical protein